ncbi:hypothetical protein Tco_1336686 [Tanacetum coccineum]
MITYLKNMKGWKHKDLKSKDFDSIKELFDKALKRVNMFVDFRTELVEEIAEVDNDQEAAKIKELRKIISDKEEVSIDAIPLAVKPPSIMYLVFSHMLKGFDKEDLETLWKLVKAKHGSTRPEEGYKRVLWGDLKGRIVGIKRLLDDLRVTAAQVCVTAAKLNTASVKLVLLVKIEENILSSYYCLCSVNAAGV